MSEKNMSESSENPDLPSSSSKPKSKRKRKSKGKETDSRFKKKKTDLTINLADSDECYCTLCEKFIEGNSTDFTEHFKNVHNLKDQAKTEKWKCPWCDRSFARTRSLKSHMENDHDGDTDHSSDESEEIERELRNPYFDDEVTVDRRGADEIEAGTDGKKRQRKGRTTREDSSDGWDEWYESDGQGAPTSPIPGPSYANVPGPSIDSWPNMLDGIPIDYNNPEFVISTEDAQNPISAEQEPIEEEENLDSAESDFELRLDEPDSNFEEQNAPDPYPRIEGGTDHKSSRPLSPINGQISDDGGEQGAPSPIQQSDGQISDDGGEQGAPSPIQQSDDHISDDVREQGAPSPIQQSDGQISDDVREEEGATTPMPDSDGQFADDEEEQADSDAPETSGRPRFSDCLSRFYCNANLRRHIAHGRCPYQVFFKKYPNATDFDYYTTPIEDYLIQHTFTGGKTQPKWSFAERLAKFGIYVANDFELNQYFAVSDIESYLFFPTHKDADGEDEQSFAVLQESNLIFKETHKPACVAVVSNLEGYRQSKCFLDLDGSITFLEKCLDYLYEISQTAFEENLKIHKKIFKKLDKQIKKATENGKGGLAVQIERLKKDMTKHTRQLPILFFNLTYDMSALIREGGFAYLLRKKDKVMPRALKNINQWITVTTDSFRFLDICNYGTGKSPLSDFLYSYGVPDESGKLYFPYASLSEAKDMMKLIADMKYEHFWSDLKQENVLETGRRKYEGYVEMGLDEKSALKKMKRTSVPKTGEEIFRELIQFCKKHNMTYLWQYLSLYCCMDVVGLVIAIKKMKESFFKLANIDVLTFCTLPSLSYTWALKEIAHWETDDNGLKFVVKLGKEAFEIIEEGIKGGSSTVLKRLAVAGMTKIREHRLPPDVVKTVQNVIYFDFNMLYGSSALSPMPVLGNYSVRRKEDDFRMTQVNGRGIMAISWLEFQSKLIHKQPMRTILSVFSEKTLLLENHQRARLDGWITTGKNKKGQCIGYSFEYHGAVVHSNPSIMSEEEFEHGLNPLNKKPNKEVYEATLARDRMIEKHPLVVKHFVIWSFEWEEQIRNEPIVRAFVEENRFTFRPDPVKEEMNWQELLDLICREKVHGVVKCSLEVPKDQYDRFSIYPPFWLHKDLTRNDLCPSEKEYAEKYGLLKIPSKNTLCHEMKVEDGVITTDLLKFYVTDLGLTCTDISVIVQFRGAGKPLLNWLNKNIERREFARTHNQPIEGQTAKLTLNTFFGTSILKAERRRLVTFAMSEQLKRYYCRPSFNGMYQAGPPNNPSAMYEIEMLKMNVQQTSSKQIGMWILQVSKMSLLDFVYNVLDKYLEPDCWEINGSDTDSIVLSVSTPGTDMRDIAKPEMVTELDAKYDKIFVTKPEDSHVPLLLKVEKEAKIFVGLASKTYLMVGNEPFHKQASKGISATKENMEVIELENYLSTLFDVGDRKVATIRGIRNDKEKSLRTYSMSKAGLRRFAPKVGYHSCHICPFPREFKDQPDVLSDIYPYACTEPDFDSVWEHIKSLSHQFPAMHLNLD